MAAVDDGREEIPSSGIRASSSRSEDYVNGYVDGANFLSTNSYLRRGGYVDGARPKAYVCIDLTENDSAIVEKAIPTKWFTDFYAEKGWKLKEGPCQWCHNVHRMMVPASTCDVYTPAAAAKTKGNAIKIKKLVEETEEADVRNLFEAFGALHCVKLYKVNDGKCCDAIVRFVNVDDAERAMEKLKGDGCDIEWSV